MAKKVLLQKGNIRREFGERAVRIAVDYLGWVEVHPLIRPKEVGTKTVPPEITKPIKLIQPPEIKTKIADIGPEPEVKEIVVKKPRKKRTPSKSKK
jgi:hypothetical protein